MAKTANNKLNEAKQMFANADALVSQVITARERGDIDAQQATYILHVVIDVDAYRARAVALMNGASSETWQDRKRKARHLLKMWQALRAAPGVVTVKRATALDHAGYDVEVGEYIVMFKRQSGRTIYLGERH